MGVSNTMIAIRDNFRGRIGQTKVKRYWPGKAPEWADGPDENQDIRMTTTVAAFRSNADADIVKRDDPRLRRLAECKTDDREEIRAHHRRIRQAESVLNIEEENKRRQGLDLEEEDEDALEESRKIIRENVLQRQQEDASLLPEEEEEEESEYETDSDEQPGIVMVKPVFVIKSERDTITERERLEAEDRAREDLTKEGLKKRKIETKLIVVEQIRKDEQIQKNMELEAGIVDVDTDDDMNEAEEYERGKVREIARIKRDRDNRQAMSKEKEEIERIRNMTEEERRERERKNPKPAAPSKQKWRHLQIYHHKGAFYQTDSDDRSSTAGSFNLFCRDFSAPTGEDKMNKTILPKVMQVKHFGRSGRTKWTHLVNEDSTDWNNPWTYNGPLRAKYNAKMAGMDAPIAKPKGNKRIRDWEF